jgi:hypothetical protein
VRRIVLAIFVPTAMSSIMIVLSALQQRWPAYSVPILYYDYKKKSGHWPRVFHVESEISWVLFGPPGTSLAGEPTEKLHPPCGFGAVHTKVLMAPPPKKLSSAHHCPCRRACLHRRRPPCCVLLSRPPSSSYPLLDVCKESDDGFFLLR